MTKFKRQSEDALQTALVMARTHWAKLTPHWAKLMTHWAGLTYKQQLGAVAAANFLAGIIFTNAFASSCPVCSSVGTTPGGVVQRNMVSVSSSSTTTTNQFDRIFQKVFEDSTSLTKMKKPKRKTLDVKWWEKKSSMAEPEGGLQRADRKLLGELYSKAESVFEYGVGESTYMANYVGVQNYAGVDSDPVKIQSARDKVAKNYRFYSADAGKIEKLGLSKGVTQAKTILEYQLEPLALERSPFDVYMVDGRYRLACALASFLHASARGGDPTQTTVLIHDCLQEGEGNHPKVYRHLKAEGRKIYHKGNSLLDMVHHSGDRLCAYKRKPETTDQQIADLYMEYSTNII